MSELLIFFQFKFYFYRMMQNFDRKNHWENIYETKTPEQVSWTQEIPETSLHLIEMLNVSKDAKIIDIGGGDGKLVDFLIEKGYRNITVLDISVKAIERARNRLGEKADQVQWIVSDIIDFEPAMKYDVWHDRAAFHFLTTREQQEKYIDLVKKAVNNYLILGAFSQQGPTRCSGLEIQQYSEETLLKMFHIDFNKIKCFEEDHKTPFSTIQNFLFCVFEKK